MSDASADAAATRPIRAAAMLIQALELDADPEEIAGGSVTLRTEASGGTYATELQTAVGPAAFLTYVYALDVPDDDGRLGRVRFEADIATLQTAAERDSPGPRLLAHATSDTEGFILATTPATFRVLSGEDPIEQLDARIANLLPEADLLAGRREAATELLRLLQGAEAQASAWLGTVAALGGLDEGDDAPALTFLEEETELALFLLDERSIRNLLRTLNTFISTARAATAGADGS